MEKVLTKERKENIIVGIFVFGFGILFYFLIDNIPVFLDSINYLLSISLPFVLGILFAVLMNPFLILIENVVFDTWNFKYKRLISIIILFMLTILLFILLSYLILPTMIQSAMQFISYTPVYMKNVSKVLYGIANHFHISSKTVDAFVGNSFDFINYVRDMITKTLPSIASLGMSLLTMFARFLVGVFATFYLLLSKEYFKHLLNKISLAIIPDYAHRYIYTFSRVCRDALYDFVVGKAMISIALGLVVFILLKILQFPYADIIATILGISNMIPVFGPIIGCAIGCIILIIVKPILVLYYSILVLVLKLIDMYFISPKILGNNLHFNTFWILFAVTIGGSLFGILGMFISLPIFVVVYLAVKEFVSYMLNKKEIL